MILLLRLVLLRLLTTPFLWALLLAGIPHYTWFSYTSNFFHIAQIDTGGRVYTVMLGFVRDLPIYCWRRVISKQLTTCRVVSSPGLIIILLSIIIYLGFLLLYWVVLSRRLCPLGAHRRYIRNVKVFNNRLRVRLPVLLALGIDLSKVLAFNFFVFIHFDEEASLAFLSHWDPCYLIEI